MPTRSLSTLLVLLTCCAFSSVLSAEDKKTEKPRVLILGDSISIGYTPYVQKLMEGEATVLRPTGKPNPKTKKARAENCAGTNNGVKNIDRWLKIDGGNWDVIHINFGLHDLKREDPKTHQASNDRNDPPQADLATYEKQLREIIGKAKETGAKIIFATTTPVPAGGVKPHRDPADVERYNAVAKKIVAEFGGEVNDLYAFCLPRLKEIQKPVNVHFSPAGSELLAKQVVEAVRDALKE